eukprot:TRINITY_DN5906_c1_g1_i1.p1 TRINITY_DN5906_c1_g1~~TRINITY_DN5906_c1_g1_i1.p1  ORF type:complete len:1225 (-),score=341.96 TRINITY_DN5906_c1_g1_i1:108-3782(-)
MAVLVPRQDIPVPLGAIRRGRRHHDEDDRDEAAALFRRLDISSSGYIHEEQVLPLWPALTQYVEGGGATDLAAQRQQHGAPISWEEWQSLMTALRNVVGGRRFKSSVKRADAIAAKRSQASQRLHLPPLVSSASAPALLPVPGAVDTSPRNRRGYPAQEQPSEKPDVQVAPRAPEPPDSPQETQDLAKSPKEPAARQPQGKPKALDNLEATIASSMATALSSPPSALSEVMPEFNSSPTAASRYAHGVSVLGIQMPSELAGSGEIAKVPRASSSGQRPQLRSPTPSRSQGSSRGRAGTQSLSDFVIRSTSPSTSPSRVGSAQPPASGEVDKDESSVDLRSRMGVEEPIKEEEEDSSDAQKPPSDGDKVLDENARLRSENEELRAKLEQLAAKTKGDDDESPGPPPRPLRDQAAGSFSVGADEEAEEEEGKSAPPPPPAPPPPAVRRQQESEQVGEEKGKSAPPLAAPPRSEQAGELSVAKSAAPPPPPPPRVASKKEQNDEVAEVLAKSVAAAAENQKERGKVRQASLNAMAATTQALERLAVTKAKSASSAAQVQAHASSRPTSMPSTTKTAEGELSVVQALKNHASDAERVHQTADDVLEATSNGTPESRLEEFDKAAEALKRSSELMCEALAQHAASIAQSQKTSKSSDVVSEALTKHQASNAEALRTLDAVPEALHSDPTTAEEELAKHVLAMSQAQQDAFAVSQVLAKEAAPLPRPKRPPSRPQASGDSELAAKSALPTPKASGDSELAGKSALPTAPPPPPKAVKVESESEAPPPPAKQSQLAKEEEEEGDEELQLVGMKQVAAIMEEAVHEDAKEDTEVEVQQEDEEEEEEEEEPLDLSKLSAAEEIAMVVAASDGSLPPADLAEAAAFARHFRILQESRPDSPTSLTRKSRASAELAYIQGKGDPQAAGSSAGVLGVTGRMAEFDPSRVHDGDDFEPLYQPVGYKDPGDGRNMFRKQKTWEDDQAQNFSWGSKSEGSKDGFSKETPFLDESTEATYGDLRQGKSQMSFSAESERGDSLPRLERSMTSPSRLTVDEVVPLDNNDPKVKALKDRLRIEMKMHEQTRAQSQELERKLKLADSKLTQMRSSNARFGVTSTAPYQAKPSELPAKKAQKESRGVYLPALKPLKPAEPRRDPGDAVLSSVKALLKEERMMVLSRQQQSRARVEAFGKLGNVGMSTWDVRRAEKVSRYQDMTAFTNSMWGSFYDWNSKYQSTER